MRALILLAAVLLILALVGWLTFSRDDGRTSINLETQEIRQDTKELLESGSQALQRAGEATEPEARSEEPRHEVEGNSSP
jgi:hypothetical protein